MGIDLLGSRRGGDRTRRRAPGGAHEAAPDGPPSSGSWGRLGWASATVLTAAVLALVPLVGDPRHYFYGDTAAAYYGWWYHLGEQVRSGHVPLLDVGTWGAGDLTAEGQWGLWSPLVMLVGLAATVTGNVLLLVTGVKVVLLCIGALGMYALARSYAVPRHVAYVVGVVAPMGGMTHFVDAPSWAAGVMIWSLVPWVWWALRRFAEGQAGPLAPLALGYLLVTVGYVYGTIALIVVLAACVVDTELARNRIASVKVVGCGLLLGLVAVTVYLPGVLTEPVTNRDHMLVIPGHFAGDPLALLTSMLPTSAVPGVTEGLFPFSYTMWFLPLLLWVDLARLRRSWRSLAGLGLFGLTFLLIIVGPERLGPLRWPLRVQPFLVQAVVLLTAVLLTHHRRPLVTPGRLAAVLAWVGLAGVVAFVRAPSLWGGHVVAALLVGTALASYWLVIRSGKAPRRALAAGAALVTLAVLLLQQAVFEPTPSPQRNLPTQVADYRSQAAGAAGNVMVVGDAEKLLEREPAAASEVLVGSAWYLNPHRVMNTFSAINHERYSDRYCVRYQGVTCPGLLDVLFTREPSTGRLRADLLGVGSLLLIRADVAAGRVERPPAGWHVAARGRWAVTWVRDHPVPAAGGPVWTSAGAHVTPVGATDGRDVRMRVDRVPAGGATVVLSRLAWPGYEVTGAELLHPTEGYLLTVRVPGDAAGRTVAASFSPPGWGFELVAWWTALIAGAGWVAAQLVGARRRRGTR